MPPRDIRPTGILAASVICLLGLAIALMADVGRPYPGFFVSPDFRVLPIDEAARERGLAWGDRIVAVDGGSPVELTSRVERASGDIRYEVARGDRRLTVVLAPRAFTWRDVIGRFGVYFVVSAAMLAAGIFVYSQNSAAAPNRNFLVYMCLWAVSNVATPESILGFRKYAVLIVGFVGVVLSVHGWVFFLTYPVNLRRQAWLDRYRIIPWLYRGAFVVGIAASLVFGGLYLTAPAVLASTYPFAVVSLVTFAMVSFPIKVVALLDTRRQADSPLVNQQTTVLLLGIGLGLGCWLTFMLAPLTHLFHAPADPQLGSALGLLYPLAIAYATVRYRLFDATLVIRRSVMYTGLAAMIAAAYAVAIAGANLVLAQAELTRSPWFSAAFMFTVALVFHPMREWMQRAVDRTFFRERADYVRTIQTLARSMTSLLDLEEITRRMTGTIETVMHVRHPRLILGAPSGPLAVVVATAPGAVSRYQVAADPSFSALAPAALEAYGALDAEVVVPLRFQEELRGLLVLGPKRSEAPYTAEDLALLETLADQSAVAVANAEAHQQVVDYAQQLERSLLIRTNLAKFVPQRVRQLIEESPEAPSLDKRETDVTVVFADITGYTRLSSRLPAEELDALVERYFGAFLDEIVKHGGDVNETAGDGLMVIFHEGDHARAAIDTARAIHRRAAEINAELAGRFEPLAMHIGINSGPALLGATKIEGLAGTRWTYTASGLTTNIAARLAGVAQGGEIVISDTTLARLAGGVPVEDLGHRDLKNVEKAVRLYRLTAG
jgi:class 3 adenylate cyclase